MQNKPTHTRLFVQLCALDERDNIARVIREIPRYIPGVTSVTVVVVDDGSSDGTGEVALAAGADEVVRHTQRQGLARAFQTGVDFCLVHGADIIVNIDADGQYRGQDIPTLIQPILSGEADIVIGNRQTHSLAHFTPLKRILQRMGSQVVQIASGLEIPDAVSGFRAYSREAALRMFVTPQFSYTVQTLIQAGKLGMAVASVPIVARETTRPSRLHRGALHFIVRQAGVLVRTYVTYEPIKTFFGLATPFLVVGLFLIGRVVAIALSRGGQFANVPSLIIGTISLLIALFFIMTGVLADRIRDNRSMLEEVLYLVRRQRMTSRDLGNSHPPAE
jgi:glycosyltransferase involved in cell wall biosynthesis